jgi:predicted RNA-binding protein associated with RNAse of E/G family
VFHYNPGHARDQDFYLDVGEFGETDPQLWRSVDHYLDIVVRTGRETELLDVDELLAAHSAGLLGSAAAEAAMHNATAAIAGIARHGYHLEPWLETRGITLTWR